LIDWVSMLAVLVLNRAYWYAEIATSCLVMSVSIASTHFAYPRRDGQAEFRGSARFSELGVPGRAIIDLPPLDPPSSPSFIQKAQICTNFMGHPVGGWVGLDPWTPCLLPPLADLAWPAQKNSVHVNGSMLSNFVNATNCKAKLPPHFIDTTLNVDK